MDDSAAARLTHPRAPADNGRSYEFLYLMDSKTVRAQENEEFAVSESALYLAGWEGRLVEGFE